MLSQHEAIVVRNAVKRYGNKTILDELNMSVSQGSIYGLLGASGCGKTTLLSCIVGTSTLNSGEIWVLGGRPGSKDSLVPGPRVGFMPQEISLVQEFTVIDALYYFGRINGLDDERISRRYVKLSDLLQLPNKHCLVKHMSGGQQRRVSLACALLHEPALLILDEPTVGLDPILRENIWNHLFDITRKQGVTTIITTHYIEETKLADKIGLLRRGKLLAETSPNRLLMKCRCDSLEEAFLRLSQKQQDSGENKAKRIVDNNIPEFLPELEEISSTPLDQHYDYSQGRPFDVFQKSININRYDDHQAVSKLSRRFQALMIKNFFQFIRHPGGILFALIFPLIQVNVFFNAIGLDPKGLQMAVINYETMNCQMGNYLGEVIYSPGDKECEFVDSSCRFLNEFDKTIAKNIFYSDISAAVNAVKKGDVVGAMFIGKNFSKALEERIDYFIPDYLTSTDIEITLDMSDRQIGLFVEKNIYDVFTQVYGDLLEECGLSRRLIKPPLVIDEPVFGEKDGKYLSFVTPVFLLTLIFFLASAVSSAVIITDRHEGIWNRSLVQGVTTAEILLSHIFTQITIVVIQVTVTTLVVFVQYSYKHQGLLAAVIFLFFIMGVCGLCFGFLISVLCTSHTVANYIVTGSFYPVVLLCGCLWPIEGMPHFLQWVSLVIPITIPGLALRSILEKGHDFYNPEVYQGFLVVAAWTVAFALMSFIGIKTKSS